MKVVIRNLINEFIIIIIINLFKGPEIKELFNYLPVDSVSACLSLIRQLSFGMCVCGGGGGGEGEGNCPSLIRLHTHTQLSPRSLFDMKGRKEMFYLTTDSTHFINGYMASDIW